MSVLNSYQVCGIMKENRLTNHRQDPSEVLSFLTFLFREFKTNGWVPVDRRRMSILRARFSGWLATGSETRDEVP
jgi:hypothetical protein